MAYSDPQSITISGTAYTLPRTGSGENIGTFRKDDGALVMGIAHNYSKRTRRVLRMDFKKTIPDPLISNQNMPLDGSIQITFNVPAYGFTPAELKAHWDGLIANLSASTGANMVKFLGGES